MNFAPLTAEQAAIGRYKAFRAEHYRSNRAHILGRVKARQDLLGPKIKAAYDRKYRLKNQEKKRAADRAYHIANRDRQIALCAIRRAADPIKARAEVARWKKAHPDDVNAHAAKRRAQKKGSSGAHTAKDMQEIMRLQGGKCANPWCRIKLTSNNRHKDHRIPLKIGGSNDRSNMQWLCITCNLKKGAKHPLDIARKFGLLL